MRNAMLRSTAMLTTAGVALALAAGQGARRADAQPRVASPSSGQFERLQGFSTVAINHVNDTLGRDRLPVASGGSVQPGVLVTISPEQVAIFDHRAVTLQGGRPADERAAAECRSGCPVAFFDAFQRMWLEAAIESTAFSVEIPRRVQLAADRDLPARTLLEVAYAAAETRPTQPPALSLLVDNARGGLRSLGVFLVPPEGIELRQGSAALGLTIEVSPGRYRVTATDPRYAREHEATSLPMLGALVRDIKKRYPSKDAVILVPDAGATVNELVRVMAAVQERFPLIILSGGQPVLTP